MGEFPDNPADYHWYTIEMSGMPVLEFTCPREARERYEGVCERHPGAQVSLVRYHRKELRRAPK